MCATAFIGRAACRFSMRLAIAAASAEVRLAAAPERRTRPANRSGPARTVRLSTVVATTVSTVAAVARRVGYESEEAFSRAFKRFHGCAPSVWRDSLFSD